MKDDRRALDFLHQSLERQALKAQQPDQAQLITATQSYLTRLYKPGAGVIKPDPLRLQILENRDEGARKKLFEEHYLEKDPAKSYSATRDSFLGFCYQLGLGTEKNLSQASTHYMAAIDKGASCWLDLYFCYRAMKASKESFLDFYQALKNYAEFDKTGSFSKTITMSATTAVASTATTASTVTATVSSTTPAMSMAVRQEARLCLAYFYEYGAIFFERDALKALEFYQRYKAEDEKEYEAENKKEKEKETASSVALEERKNTNNYVNEKCKFYADWKSKNCDFLMNVLGDLKSENSSAGLNFPKELGRIVSLYAFNPLRPDAPVSTAATTAAVPPKP